MKLYHGSNVEVRQPKILMVVKTSDFGPAFYTTSSLEQSVRWSRIKARRRKVGKPIVSIYEFDYSEARKNLRMKEFPVANEEWLDFVVANRSNDYHGARFDLIIGPVADDQAITVLDDYMAGLYTKQIALQLLEPQNLIDQYAFLSSRALEYLTCIGVDNYEI